MELREKCVVIRSCFDNKLYGNLSDVVKFLADIEAKERDNYDRIKIDISAYSSYDVGALETEIIGYRMETEEEAQVRLDVAKREAERQVDYAKGHLINIAKKHGTKLIEDYLKENK